MKKKKKKKQYRWTKQLIILDYMANIDGLKSVCPICVKYRRLSRNNASHDIDMRRNNVKKCLLDLIRI